MTEEQKPSILERCEIKVVENHFECECLTSQDREELARILQEEAILRVKPKVVLD